jgi:hypothetical protein
MTEKNLIEYKQMNEHSYHCWGQCCSKTIQAAMLFKDNPSSNWCYRIVAFEWMLEGCTHQEWLWDYLFWSPKVHFTAWIWVINIIDNAKSFLCISWFDKLRRTHWGEHQECNKKPFTTTYEIHVWMTWQFPRRLINIYLKSIVLTGGKFMTD